MCTTSSIRNVGVYLIALVIVLLAGLPAMGQWQIQSIAPVSPGMPWTFWATPALTFDGQDRPNVAYEPATRSIVLHVRGSSSGSPGTWTALSTGVNAQGPSTVHLASTGNLVYLSASVNMGGLGSTTSAVFDGTGWQAYSPPAFYDVYGSSLLCGMATDAAGKVNWILSCSHYTSGVFPGFNLLRQTDPSSAVDALIAPGILPASWITGAADDILRLDGDVAFDSSGNIRTIQYYELSIGGFLMYAEGPTTGPFTIDTNVDISWVCKTGHPSIAVDAAGKSHIVYTTAWPYYRVTYLKQTATGWQRQTIDTNGNYAGYVGTFPKILIDTKQTVHVIYADTLHGQVKHAKLVADRWQIEIIDTVGTQSSYSVQTGILSAAMDSIGGIGVVYWNGSEGALKYAYSVP